MAGVKGKSGIPKGYQALNKYEKSVLRDSIPKGKDVLPYAVKLIFDPDTPLDYQVKLIGIVMPFLEPKLASGEIKAQVENKTTLGIEPDAENRIVEIIRRSQA